MAVVFPDAPPGSYVSDEGWLIVGDEAWTLEEWMPKNKGGRPIQYDDERHRKDRERNKHGRKR